MANISTNKATYLDAEMRPQGQARMFAITRQEVSNAAEVIMVIFIDVIYLFML
ncbi:MAG: hypothetical protein Q8881_02770 [Sweet potato little leaf phytoplasma]|nr:hypothetical protein [Sweet potato little leaf phytoplasma]